jgi:hypothetical protein
LQQYRAAARRSGISSSVLPQASKNMRATHTMPAEKPAVAGRLARDFQRAFLICGIALAFGLLVTVAAMWLRPVSPERSRAANEARLSTGSMLIVDPTGTQCRESTIDNSTWRIRSNGPVDCDEALAKAANAGADTRSPGSRLELIRQGFTGRQ